MNNYISNIKPKYTIALPVCYFDFVKIRQAAKAAKMTTPEYLRMKLNLDALSEREKINRKFSNS
jgi:hypothetical protein